MKYFIVFCMLTLSLSAHSLKIFATKKDGFLNVKSYFTTSSVCVDCNVSVKKNDGSLVSFKTNDKGEVKIPLSINPIKVTVVASLGHKNSIDIKPEAKKSDTSSKQALNGLDFWQKLFIGFIFIFAFFGVIWKMTKK